MPHLSNDPIVVYLNGDAPQWTAYFQRVPQFASGGSTPVHAVRWLLEASEQGHGTFAVECRGADTLSVVVPNAVIWDPPELLVPCAECQGRGEYVGLLVVEKCQACGGRSLVPA